MTTLIREGLRTHNGMRVAVDSVPVLGIDEFRDFVIGQVNAGNRISAMFGMPVRSGTRLFAVIAQDARAALALVASDVSGSYPAITPECTQAHLFEREICEQCGVVPQGHPWLKPVRFPQNGAPSAAPCLENPFRVEGEEIHEVAVGPVHAGIIEPGHFRFQCHGEKVFSLEISLGYQHRGIECALVGKPTGRSICFAETVAGDTTIGHATAYCSVLEALCDCPAPPRGDALRGVALELERMANHVGDLGALAGDVGYLPTAAYCGRIRGDVLNTTAVLCGNRFGRGLVRPGGSRFDMDASMANAMTGRLDTILDDAANAIELLWTTPSVLARFEGTGFVSEKLARQLGLVGVVARACGLEQDVRFEHASGVFQFSQLPVSTWDSGDVFARAYVRWLEIQRSAQFVREQLRDLPGGPALTAPQNIAPASMAVSLVEGWRGEICHVGITDSAGEFVCYKIVDPSFHNWTGLAMALRGQQISDFPLCNKSFNLSYCGHDL